SNSSINQQATTTGNITTNNPNLVGKGNSTDEVNAYRSALRREIEKHKRYPNRARMMRKQGVVTITFHLNNAGVISNARISKSSGSEELDNAALVAVNNARPIGPLPVGMPNEVSVPVSFRITN
ncbi:TPA: energy transducer TonB, partial [Pasteurella multocida]|nr:energy transducer TonB [Pasteurella multocida]HDR1712334.1 energy transducer TonB [Pasteurella multocida]